MKDISELHKTQQQSCIGRKLLSINHKMQKRSLKKTFGIFLFFLSSVVVMGQRKSIQEQLGYPKDAKLLIIHADDVGVSHSENAASISALETGSVNSASIMVPCPWFPEIAAYARLHPEIDFGLHITLTSEWKYYNWGPVSPVQEIPGLVNKNGFFYSSVDSVIQNATPAEVEKEIRNQVKRALQFGINPTHLDGHMYTVHQNLGFLKSYIKIGHEFNIPVFINRQVESSLHIKLDTVVSARDVIIDTILTAEFDNFKTGMSDFYTAGLKNLKPGITYLIIHTAYDDAEMRAVTTGHDGWGAAWRQKDYDFFTSPLCAKILKENNIYLVSWREIRDKITRNNGQ
jgi:chitin disaccharide deacetylase